MNYRSLLSRYPFFAPLQQLADRAHLETYLVGGFVRDLFLQRPCKDVDILCVGDAISLAQRFAQSIGAPKVAIFKNFGTAMVRFESWEIEFVAARKESYRPESRKPHVVRGTLHDDLGRRDFTCNSLALGLNKDHFGDLLDLFGGLADLDRGILRTPLDPGRTFSDDPLRMWRAIRFATELDFQVESTTWAGLCAQVGRLDILSPERITSELNKILLTDKPDRGLYLLDKAGLLRRILPELERLKGKESIGRHTHKENFKHTLQVVRNVADQQGSLWLRWAALLHDIAKPDTKHFDAQTGFSFHGHETLGAKKAPPIFRRLRLPLKQEMRYVQKLIRLHLRHVPLIENEVTPAAIRRFIYDAGDELTDLLVLAKADITSENQKKVATYRKNFDRLAQKIMQVEEQDRIRALEPAIDGNYLMKTFGLKPCREVGLLKHTMKELVLDGKVANTREALYPHMIRKAQELGLAPLSTS